MVEPLPDDLDLDPRWTTSIRPAMVTGHKGDAGPYDSEDSESPEIEGALDFGSLRVPLPARAQLQVEKGGTDLLRAVHVLVPSGRVSLSALAAPRSAALWRELSQEIADSLSREGARLLSEWGEWGREVQAGSNGALSRFIGVDGPRWMLYGVATGPAESAAELANTLRRMIRETVVARGPDPLPVKTVLPLRLPEHLEQRVEQSRKHTEDRAGLSGTSSETVYIDPEADGPVEAEPGWDDEYGTDPDPYVPQPPDDDEFGDSQLQRSIGLRRAELRPVTPRAPVPRHPSAPPREPVPDMMPAARRGPMPPVQSSDTWDTQGIPRVTPDSTWTMAIPVVSSDEVQHQPAWADLAAAPSFWPEPRPSTPVGPDRYGTGPGGAAKRDRVTPPSSRTGALPPVVPGPPPAGPRGSHPIGPGGQYTGRPPAASGGSHSAGLGGRSAARSGGSHSADLGGPPPVASGGSYPPGFDGLPPVRSSEPPPAGLGGLPAARSDASHSAELGGAELGGAELGGAELGGAELGGAELGGAELGGLSSAGLDRPYPAGSGATWSARSASPEPDPWRPPTAEPPGARFGELEPRFGEPEPRFSEPEPRFSEPEPRWDSLGPEDSQVDSLHDALTSDAAVTQARPRVQRRGRPRSD
jgi:hypothetical protein